jgi:hypothetical protein
VSAVDPITQAWIRNASDVKAAAVGCRFNVERGSYTVFWVERYCRLYEGESFAGLPMILAGCHDCGTYDLPSAIELDEWEDPAKEVYAERARRYAECVRAGHALDWQYECTMRLYGWERYSERWKQWIRRFRDGSLWMPKKNKKSPTLAAWGIYLLCGDGEPGQKVFPCAKDGTAVAQDRRRARDGDAGPVAGVE